MPRLPEDWPPCDFQSWIVKTDAPFKLIFNLFHMLYFIVTHFSGQYLAWPHLLRTYTESKRIMGILQQLIRFKISAW